MKKGGRLSERGTEGERSCLGEGEKALDYSSQGNRMCGTEPDRVGGTGPNCAKKKDHEVLKSIETARLRRHGGKRGDEEPRKRGTRSADVVAGTAISIGPTDKQKKQFGIERK